MEIVGVILDELSEFKATSTFSFLLATVQLLYKLHSRVEVWQGIESDIQNVFN